ncbi:hypothetical protein Aduo_019203 [Ancylostoma duodenale]
MCEGRAVTEQVWFGVKQHFQCTIRKSAKVIVAAYCLRNMCVEARKHPFTEEEAIPQQFFGAGDEEVEGSDAVESDALKRHIAYFRH